MQQDHGASLRDRAFVPSTSSPQAVSTIPASIPSASGSYLTCRNCAVDRSTCERRAHVRAGIRGLGLTSIRFRCDARVPLYRPGQRVEVTWKYYPPDWDHYEGYSLETWPATVVHESKKGFVIAVDDVASDNDLPAREYIKNENLYCNVVAGKLKALDEPDRRTCEVCRSAENADGTVTGCWGTNGYDNSRVENCLASAIEARRAETGTGSVHESAVPEADAQSTQPDSSS